MRPSMRKDWWPALKDGLRRAGAALPKDDEVAFAFYGDLFRPEGKMGVGIPPLTASDIDDPLEVELLLAWWREAAARDRQIPGPDDSTMARIPTWIQRALNALCQYPFFADLGERFFIWDLKQ